MSLWLPPEAIAEERRRFAAAVLRCVTIEDTRARECTAALQRIDPRLFMVKAHEKIKPGVPVMPGYYHILRHNENAPLSVFMVHHDGAYVEPTSRIFDRLAEGDLHDPRVFREMRDLDRKAHEEGERDIARDHEDRRAELRERVNAAVRTQVSMDRTLPWTQNSSGRAKNGRG